MGLELPQQYKDVQVMEEVNFSDSELVDHVRQALLSVQSGDTDSYDQLLGVFGHTQRLKPDEVALLVTSLKAVSGAVSYIDFVHHYSLLSLIFGMNMWNCGPDVIEALVELITSLAASNGKYIDSCLIMLVSNFVPAPESYWLDLLQQPCGQAKKEQVLSHVHKALEDITTLLPLAGMRLSSIVEQKMPMSLNSKRDAIHRIELFVENMLRLASGPIKEIVESKMLGAVVYLLTDLDVALGGDDILRDDSSRGIFAIELEDEDGASVDDEENDDAEFPKALTRKYLGKNDTADLLDRLMVKTFEHLECCANNNRLNKVFEILVNAFKLTILNTYKSKFAQFVMFYACALDPQNCGMKFAKTLLDWFIHGENPLTRMSAVAYLASYLARGKFLSASYVASILKRLVAWCSEYCKIHYGGMNPQAHKVFYAGFQAVMYVLCFRMGSMMDVPGMKLEILLPIQPILKHNLEPLKVCLPSIVLEFLKQAKAANLFTISKMFIFSDLLESDLSKEFGGIERLDTFFPFDPCLLRHSDRGYIGPNFIYWKHVRTTYYPDNMEFSSDEEIADDFGDNEIEEEIQLNFGEQVDIDIDDEFDNAMNKMSITPKNGLIHRFGADRMQMPSRIRPSMSPESL